MKIIVLFLSLIVFYPCFGQETTLSYNLNNNGFNYMCHHFKKMDSIYVIKKRFLTYNTNLSLKHNDGKIYISKDYGETWDFKCFGPKYVNASTLYVIDENKFFLITTTCGYRTIDGGKTWENFTSDQFIKERPLYMSHDIFILSSGFSNENEGMMVVCVKIFENPEYGHYKSYIRLMKTCDGGKTWNEIKIDTNPKMILNKIGYYKNIAFATYSNGDIYKSEDHGKTWSLKGNIYTTKWTFIMMNDSLYYDATTIKDYIFITSTYTKPNTW